MDPAAEAVAAHYDRLAATGGAAALEAAHAAAAEALVERVPLRPDASVLEIGCGTGHLAARAAARGAAVTALDVSPRMLELARARFTSNALPALAHGWFPDDAPTGPFDAIFELDALVHVSDLRAALRSVHQRLVPGGVLASAQCFYAENTASHGRPRAQGLPLRLHSALGWRRLLEGAGFEIEAQGRLREEPGAAPPWRARQGFLFTIARRPAP